MNTFDLGQLRAQIDQIDLQLQELLNARATLAQAVVASKRNAGAGADVYRPEREAQILRAVAARQQGPLSVATMQGLFREIMAVCRQLQAPTRVAYLGPPGTYTQQAALKQFGQTVELAPLATITDVFREVEADAVHYGVVPIENSSEGAVTHTLDCFLGSTLHICGEILLPVHHHLLARTGDLTQVRCVYAHPQALAQCQRWLSQHLPQVSTVPVSSNGEAARRVQDEAQAAAIASEAAAQLYGLQTLAARIEDDPNNTTRFLVIGKQSVPPSGADKTSLLLATSNQPGALYRLLEPFARHGVSLSRIESRPSRRAAWDYVFFVDSEGHAQEPAVAAALAAVRESASEFRILGAYPKAIAN